MSDGLLLLHARARPGPPDGRDLPEEPCFGAEDAARLARFGDPAARALRVQGRRLLAAGLRELGVDPEKTLLLRAPGGRPLLSQPGILISFSYTDRAHCLLAETGELPGEPGPGLDCEDLRADFPPPDRVFSDTERRAMAEELAGFEGEDRKARDMSGRLRRWCVKEALLKALGTGLRLDPALADTGPAGSFEGAVRLRGETFVWRSLPLAGGWCALALPAALAPCLERMRRLTV